MSFTNPARVQVHGGHNPNNVEISPNVVSQAKKFPMSYVNSCEGRFLPPLLTMGRTGVEPLNRDGRCVNVFLF